MKEYSRSIQMLKAIEHQLLSTQSVMIIVLLPEMLIIKVMF
jgi:hypothetical protein